MIVRNLGLVLFTAICCITCEKATPIDSTIIVYQNNIESTTRKEAQEFQLTKDEFSIRFYNKEYDDKKEAFYSAQITAFLDKSEFSKLEDGMMIENSDCFGPGTGMATDTTGRYESLFITPIANHYLVYGNNDKSRLNLLSEKNGVLKLEFIVNAINIDGQIISIKDILFPELYLAILIDRNLNGIIDSGELTKLTLKFF